MPTLTLEGIRSIGSAEIDLSGQIILLAGDNGVGKTSTLLALKSLLTGTTTCISSKQKDDADGMCADGLSKRASGSSTLWSRRTGLTRWSVELKS